MQAVVVAINEQRPFTIWHRGTLTGRTYNENHLPKETPENAAQPDHSQHQPSS
jgi:hypothetical protein